MSKDGDIPKFVEYRYSTNQNVVLRTVRRKDDGEGITGEVESLKSKMGSLKMGDLAQRIKPPTAKGGKDPSSAPLQPQRRQGRVIIRKRDVLQSQISTENFYQPTNERSRIYFEELLHFITPYLSDVSSETIHACADEVLAILKDESILENKKFVSILPLLNGLKKDDFATLIRLGKSITDYFKDSMGEGGEEDSGQLDEDLAEEGMSLMYEQDESTDYVTVLEEDRMNDDDDGVETSRERVLKKRSGQEGKGLPSDDFLEGLIGRVYQKNDVSDKLEKVHEIICDRKLNPVGCENELVEVLDFHTDIVKEILPKRWVLCYLHLWSQSLDDKKELQALKAEMISKGFQSIVTLLEEKFNRKMDVDSSGGGGEEVQNLDLESIGFEKGSHFMDESQVSLPPSLVREKFKGYDELYLPAPARPATRPDENLVPVSSLPPWARPCFLKIKRLNRIQSVVFKSAFTTDVNMLVCAPTGAGKTIVAVLTVLRELQKHMEVDENGRFLGFFTKNFKVIYIAPMKALVQEIVGKMRAYFKPYDLRVEELTGDSTLSRHQISETQVIVSTPEKWDIVTRKSDDRTFVDHVRLIIFDEIHLLHDIRGSVLEAIIARTLRYQDEYLQRNPIRFLGISATLPNYRDVSQLCRVPANGLFHFGNAYRPVPLDQYYVGITEKKVLKKLRLMNEVCYKKVMERMDQSDDIQVIVFVHSRKETANTARYIRDMAREGKRLQNLLRGKKATQQVLKMEAENAKNLELKELLADGFGIHHAGMVREDRSLVESLFDQKHIRVLCSTATLAWGVNLPAHTVIIKGTQIYSPEESRWVELSMLDIMQMMGRAGRPGKDTEGEGIVITTAEELLYYLSLFNQQLKIESQMVRKLPDHLNAEVSMGSITTMKEAVAWLGYTYLYIRMKANPELYAGISPEEMKKRDPELIKRRKDLIHSAAVVLHKNGLVQYDSRYGTLQPTEIGKIASHYYIPNASMAVYNRYLQPHISEIDLFRLFSLSDEFQFMVVRQEEKIELQRLYQRVPVPIRENADEPSTKINLLLQSYVSRIGLQSFSLVSDLTYVTQSAVRIVRALFEITLRRGWAQLTGRVLELAKMIEQRMWPCQCPLRQFLSLPKRIRGGGLTPKLIDQLEGKDISWERLYDLSVAELGELVRFPSKGREIYRRIHQFPRLEVTAHVQPVTNEMLHFDLVLQADFEYKPELHGPSMLFYIFVEDADQKELLHFEFFLLQGKRIGSEHYVSFPVFLEKRFRHPIFYIRITSDRWIGSETVLPVFMKRFIFPTVPKEKDFLTPKFDQKNMQLRTFGDFDVSALKKQHNAEMKGIRELVRSFQYLTLNDVQTQLFPPIWYSEDNLFVGAGHDAQLMVMGEIAIMKCFYNHEMDQVEKSKNKKKKEEGEKKEEDSDSEDDEDEEESPKILYLSPFASKIAYLESVWKKNKIFGEDKDIRVLQGLDSLDDLKDLVDADIILSLPSVYETFIKKWQKYIDAYFESLKLVIVDDMHLISGARFLPSLNEASKQGHALEMVITRLKFIQKYFDTADHYDEEEGEERPKMRILGFSLPTLNPKDMGEFLGGQSKWFNFFPSKNSQVAVTDRRDHLYRRSIPSLRLNMVATFTKNLSFTSRLLSMIRKLSVLYFTELKHNNAPKYLVICPSSQTAKLAATEMIYYFKNTLGQYQSQLPDISNLLTPEDEKQHGDDFEKCYRHRIPYYHKSMSQKVRRFLVHLFFTQGDVELPLLFVPNSFDFSEVMNTLWSLQQRNDARSSSGKAWEPVVLGTEYFSSLDNRYINYSILQIHHFIQQASLICNPPTISRNRDNNVVKKLHIFTNATEREYYTNFLEKRPFLPVESQLDHHFTEHLNTEISYGRVKKFQHGMDLVSHTYLFRRLLRNPNFYNLHVSETLVREHGHRASKIINREVLQEFLSQFIEQSVKDLGHASCITAERTGPEGGRNEGGAEEGMADEDEEDQLVFLPLPVGQVAAQNGVLTSTCDLFDASMTANTKLRGILEIISHAAEFEGAFPVRGPVELEELQRLRRRCVYVVSGSKGDGENTVSGKLEDEVAYKVNILLQSYFSREQMAGSLRQDVSMLLSVVFPRLFKSMMGILNLLKWVKPAIYCLEFCQMVCQGVWTRESYLRQIPWIGQDKKFVDELEHQYNIKSVFDLIEMEDGPREEVFTKHGIVKQKMQDVADFLNVYPNVDVEFKVSTELLRQDKEMEDEDEGPTKKVIVELTLELDDEEESEGENDDEEDDEEKEGIDVEVVTSRMFREEKKVEWWVLIGDKEANILYTTKHIRNLRKSKKVKIEFDAPSHRSGVHKLSLYFMCDSYTGCDQEYNFEINV